MILEIAVWFLAKVSVFALLVYGKSMVNEMPMLALIFQNVLWMIRNQKKNESGILLFPFIDPCDAGGGGWESVFWKCFDII